jgi:hypothetical protein
MADRNTSADAGRKGAPSETKATKATQCTIPSPRGSWLPAYSGGMGRTGFEVDPQLGTAGEEVGNDYDD